MTVGILGLGLIGGSLARTYAKSNQTVLVCEQDASVFSFAQLSGAVHGRLDDETIIRCDVIFLAIYPDGCMQWLEKNASYIRNDTIVIDCCGVKEDICSQGFSLAQKYGFTFVGGHPMAGSHFSGFKYSRSNLFQGAPMVLVPPRYDDIQLLQRIKEILAPCNFGSFSITTAKQHDRLIAFTSQMPHIISNAFIKSPTAYNHTGFSAGSYKDLTRVAWLNPSMWAELFLANKENVLAELDYYMDSLRAYRDAIDSEDLITLQQLLEEGKHRKEEVDG